MANFIPYDRGQGLLLPPGLRDWVPEDDLAHFMIEAVERVSISVFKVNHLGTGKAQYHPRMMLALLIYCYANGIFSSRRIERATHRDVAVRFIAADRHPDHDTIAAFRRENGQAFTESFTQVLLLAGELGLFKLGMVSIDGTKIDASASKIKSVRYDRIQVLWARLETDIAALVAKAEAADLAGDAPETLPEEIARRERLKAKLDAAERLEAEARSAAEADWPAYEDKKRIREARGGAGRKPKPPDDAPPPERQTNLVDPDSRLMRKSKHHEYRQAYNAQAVVDADGSQLVLMTTVGQTPSEQPTFRDVVDALCRDVGQPDTILADAGYAIGETVTALQDQGIEMLVAVAGTQGRRPDDFRPPGPEPAKPRAVLGPWRRRMLETLQTEDAKAKYRRRKCTVEPVFGIIKSVLGFTRFHLRGLENVKLEWLIVTLAYNAKRLCNMKRVKALA